MRKSFVLIAAVALFLSGCVYYNTYYNAKKLYRSAYAKPLNTQGRPVSQAVKDYNDVIKKCGKIITNHKNSNWTDDAAFLMAKALYYKQTSKHKALRQFQELAKNFPNSEFTPEAKLYIIRINRQIHKIEEANTLMTDFLIDPTNKEWFNRAHLLAAEFNIENKEYTKAEYHLESILEGDKKSEEYVEAYFNLGKTYHLSKEYAQSSVVFNELLKLKAPNTTKLDARYYLAYNSFHLGDYVVAKKLIKHLLRKENRMDQIPWVKLLQGRILHAEGSYDEFVTAIKFILDNHARKEVSAEAAYYLGEYYLYDAFDYAEAIVYYNKVKTEFKKSQYVEQAMTKSSVASQIQLLSDPARILDPEALVNEQFKLAEYFTNIMELPDSALVVYDRIIDNESILVAQLDTLRLELDSVRVEFEVKQDSLEIVRIAEMAEADSLEQVRITELAEADSLVVEEVVEVETVQDSLVIEVTESDSTATEVATRPVFEESQEYRTVNNKIENIEKILAEYGSKILPFTYFVKSWIFLNAKSDSVSAEQNYSILKSKFPANEYTYACSLMLIGEKPVLESPIHIREQAIYDNAIEIMSTNPDSAIVLLSPFTEEVLSEFYLSSIYTTGYINFAVKADTLGAATWFDRLLEEDTKDKYRANVAIFYRDGQFLHSEPDADEEIIEETEKKEGDGEFIEPSEDFIELDEEVKIDSLEVIKEEPKEIIKPIIIEEKQLSE